MPFFTNFSGEGSPTNRDYRTKGTLILTSLVEDLGKVLVVVKAFINRKPNGRKMGGWWFTAFIREGKKKMAEKGG